MRYMGSKRRIADEILPIILDKRTTSKQLFVEPFAGGMNITERVIGNRWANDINEYLIALFNAVIYNNWCPPIDVSKELYIDVRDNKDKYPKHLVGWIGFGCTFGAKFFGGYCNLYKNKWKTKTGIIPSYQNEGRNTLLKQVNKLYGVRFTCMSYLDMVIPSSSIIYCDPPYKNTANYNDIINYDLFYDWCIKQKKNGSLLYVSEYDMPKPFKCVWEKQITTTLQHNGNTQLRTEKLFII